MSKSAENDLGATGFAAVKNKCGDKDDRWDRARFTELGRNVWMLSFPKRTSGWEKTPFIGSLEEVAETLVTNFGWQLEAQ